MLPITGNQTIFLISVRHRYYVELVLVLLIRIVTIETNEYHPLIFFLEPSFRGKKRVMEIKDPFQFISRYIFSPLEISPSKKDRGVDKFVICIFLFLKKTPLKERYKFRERESGIFSSYISSIRVVSNSCFQRKWSPRIVTELLNMTRNLLVFSLDKFLIFLSSPPPFRAKYFDILKIMMIQEWRIHFLEENLF